MKGPLGRAAQLFNYVEVGLWTVLGAIVLVYALRRSGKVRAHGLIAAFTLVAFGASDWVENATGGEWWRPWWLLLWKAACVVVLLMLGVLAHLRNSRKPRGETT